MVSLRSPLCRDVASLFPALAFFLHYAIAQQQCTASGGFGICPLGNTCCPLPTVTDNPSGCIPNDLGSNGVCCGLEGGGCPPKYVCTAHPQSSAPICQRDPTTDPDHIDPLAMTIPRYQLCSPPKETLVQMHGLPVLNGSGDIAYYSSHGPILSSSMESTSANIQAALIIVHGQSRNADDYFCAGHRASQLQDRFKSVLVIAPKFLEMQDGNVTLSSGRQALRWGRSDSSKDIDQAGVWRYGTDAIYPPSSLNISSFDALDAVVSSLLNSTRFLNLEQVVVFGHSSGGQMVQRWSLLTSVENESIGKSNDALLPLELRPDWQTISSHRTLRSTNAHLRFIVANPSSYCYLDESRYINGTFQRPPKHIRQSCPQNNQWEYGFHPGGPTDIRYKNLAIEKAGGLPALVQRYADKDVIYLAGSQDRCPTAELGGWCNSHGIETTCMDMVQGRHRLERHTVFMQSLQHFFGRKVHRSQIIPGVGHDHSTILHSKEGLAAVFG